MKKVEVLRSLMEQSTHRVYFQDLKRGIETQASSKAKAISNAIERLIPVTNMSRAALRRHYNQNPQYIQVEEK